MAANDITITIQVDGTAAAIAQLGLLRKAAGNLGQPAGGAAGQGFMAGFVANLRTTGITAGVVAALVGLPAALAAAGATAGIALGAGLLISAKNTLVSHGFHDMFTGLIAEARQAAKPLIQPLLDAFRSLANFAQGTLMPALRQVFKAVAPDIGPLVSGFERLMSGILPGFIALLRASLPAMTAFGNLLGDTGAGIGGALKAMAPAVAASSKLWAALGSVIRQLLPVLGQIVAIIAKQFAPVLGQVLVQAAKTVVQVLKALEPSLNSLAHLFAAVIKALLPILPPLTTLTVLIIKQLTPGLLAAIHAVTDLVTWIGIAIKWVSRITNTILGWIHINQRLGTDFNTVVAQIGGGFTKMISAGGRWHSAWTTLVADAKAAWDQFASAIVAVWNSTVGAIINGINAVAGAINGLINSIGQANAAVGGLGAGLGHFGLASGGITGAQGGGPRSRWTMVGEHGRELVKLPPGTQVHSNPDTERMLAGAGGAARDPVALQVVPGGQNELQSFLVFLLKNYVRVYGQGNVQTALGWHP